MVATTFDEITLFEAQQRRHVLELVHSSSSLLFHCGAIDLLQAVQAGGVPWWRYFVLV